MEEFENLQQLYQRLNEIFINERELEDELLPYYPEVVECIVEQITHMNKILDRSRQSKTMNSFKFEFHKLEIERFSFLLFGYLRIRLKKIERNASQLIQLLNSDMDRALKFLSRQEAKYLDRYNIIVEQFIKNRIEDMPDNMKRFSLAGLKQGKHYKYAFVMGTQTGSVQDGPFQIQIEPNVCRILSVEAIVNHLENDEKICLKLI